MERESPQLSDADAVANPANSASMDHAEASPKSANATPKPPFTQPRRARSGTSLSRARSNSRHSVISLSSEFEITTPSRPPRRPLRPLPRAQRPKIPIPPDAEVISISSDTEPEDQNPAESNQTEAQRAFDPREVNATRMSEEANAKDLRGVPNELLVEDPSRTALLKSPFYGKSDDGLEQYQPDVVYPWELTSSSSEDDFEFITLPTARERERLLAAAEGNSHVYQAVTDPVRVPDLPGSASERAPRKTWYLRVVIWYQNDVLPVTKSLCIDGEGFVTLGRLPAAKQVFQDAGVDYFHLWNFRQTSWERLTLKSLIHISTERGYHTLLLRMTTVQRCPLFEVKLLEASSESSHYGHTRSPLRPPATPKGKVPLRDVRDCTRFTGDLHNGRRTLTRCTRDIADGKQTVPDLNPDEWGPGLFNALTGLGGGSMLKATTNSNANSALYAIFAAVAFIVGADDILLKVSGFVIASGASLSSCAGFLWTTQDSLMLAYQTEDQKGECIGIFWAGMVGAAAFLGKNYRNTASAFSEPRAKF
ncbi:hypothetical protein FKP32DRAFT_1671022 [Trametes sanguinea]|nr:hypothetical protein FKP32DRAFT_1671022 [Trametes sanguinea]